ncbi:MAG: TraB/GumN family protein [Prevotellaceae bacterium]|jgi:uncharacterized protein YbaP (TraB family)|nr:TraB/GumN family protein [Prevotellaceae bacterium]
MKKMTLLLVMACLALGSVQAQLLWKIEGKDLSAPSYVIGTHHLIPLQFKDSIAGLAQAMTDTRQVYGEVVMSEMMTPAFMQQAQQAGVMTDGTTLQSLLSAADYQRLGEELKALLSVDVAMLNVVKPAAVMQTLTMGIYLKEFPGFNPQEQLDGYFQREAVAEGKKVGGLETPAGQLEVLFGSQSLQRQAELLVCTLNNLSRTVDQAKRLNAAYRKQDLEALLRLMEERENNSCDPRPEEWNVLIDDRNKAWMVQLPAVMRQAPTLFAVGAGHLPGKNGLLNLLKQAGYRVTAVR